jgi:hypothetical protein
LLLGRGLGVQGHPVIGPHGQDHLRQRQSAKFQANARVLSRRALFVMAIWIGPDSGTLWEVPVSTEVI